MTASRPAAPGRVQLRGSDRGYFVASLTADPLAVVTHGFCSGHAAGVGRYGLVTRQLIRLDTLVVADGAFMLTTANGDTLSGAYEGRASFADEPGVIVFETSGAVTGGTGCFAGATGALAFDGRADLATGDLGETVRGWIVSSPPCREAFARPLRTSHRLPHREGLDRRREER